MADSKTINVLLIDDNELLRRGLRSALETYDDLEVIGEGGNGQAAVELCRTLHPDVVVMDVKMPRMSGIEATHVIHQEFPHIGIVFLSVFQDFATKETALQAGASDYLFKNVSIETIVNAIRRAAAQ